MNKRKKYIRYGEIIFYISKILSKTISWKYKIDPDFKKDEVYNVGFWHDTIIIQMINVIKKCHKTLNMVSPSYDGEIIATPLKKYGYEVIRGSSNEGGAKSLIRIIREIKKRKISGGFAVDGPTGPRHKVKPGIIYVAKKTQKKIVPLGGAFSKKWVIEKSWDKLQIPKPFSKGIFMVGKPFLVPKDADIEKYQILLEKKIDTLNKKAEAILNKEKNKEK
ncbi:MAG: lysophospholipid acyltransferase family protein [Fusobacteriota bacterium]